jgi:hypothetical protein
MTIKSIATLDHKDTGAVLQLPEAARRLVLDRQDRTLAVLGAQSVTLYDVAGWLAGTATEVMGVSANLPGAVAADFSVDGSKLYVVTGAPGCSGGCTLHILDAHGGAAMGMAMLPEYTADIAVEQTTGSPVIAIPGGGALVWLDAQTAMSSVSQANQPHVQIVVATGAATVGFASGDTRIDQGCSPPAGGSSKATAMLVLPSQPPRKVDLDMPPFLASFSSDPQAANQANAKITTAQFTINRAAVTPDAGRAMLWVTANYCGRFNVSSGTGGTLCRGVVQARDELVMLVDLASGKTISAESTQEQLSTCNLDCNLFQLDCIGTVQLPNPQFVPSGVTVLFGGK